MKKIRIFFSILLIFSIAAFSPLLYTNDIHTVQAASTIQISDKSLTLALGHYKTLRIYGTTRSVSWRSSNNWIASVSGSGKVTAKAPGTVTITASVAGKKLTCKVTVIRINKYTLTMTPGNTSNLSIIGTNSEVAWTSIDEAVATVSSTGKVTAIAPGVASVTAFVDGKEITSKITVVDISHKSIVLELGGWSGYVKTLKINGTTSPVSWSSGNKSVATVASTGKVTAKGAGSTVITASINGIKFTCNVKVLKMSTKEFTLKAGETKKLKIYGTTGEITWHSNDTDTAVVSSDGTVTAKAVGDATITGFVDGRKVTSHVTVVADTE